jgi:hypothetical protein
LVFIGPAQPATAPSNVTVPNQTAAQGGTATFTVSFSGAGGPFTFQWSTNATAIPGATNNTYKTGQLHARDNGIQFSVKVTNPQGSASGTGTLTVTPYTTPPTVVSAGAVNNAGTFQVGVTFSQFLDPTTAQNTANYTLASGTVSSAVYDDSIGGVVLTVSSLTAGVSNSVTVANVKNASGIVMASAQTVPLMLTTPITLTDVDVGTPTLAGTFKQIGADPYLGSPIWQQTGGGNDIWNNADNFNYAYTHVQGDFTAIVNIRSLTGENWSKAELMARQNDFASATVTPGAGDPQVSNMTTPADQNNTVQLQYRDVRDAASANANTGAATPTYPHTWLRMTRLGDAIRIDESPDANTWTTLATHFLSAGQWTNDINIGIAVTRHNDGSTNPATATWSNFGFPAVPLAFTTPLPATTAALEGRKVVLSVVATGNPLNYQWSKGGTDIPGEMRSTLTLNNIQPSDAGAYSVRIFSTPGGTSIHSDTMVTVTPYPPIPSASALSRQDGIIEVGVTFDELINLSTLVAGNFTLSGGGTVTGLKVSTNSYVNYEAAALQTTGLKPGSSYVLTVKNVSDLSGQTITSTNINFTVGGLTWYETGTPKTPGQIVPVGTNGFDILNGGRQEWGNYDEITMAYVAKTNDFDVRVRVEYAEPGSEWTRVGLQARNALNVGEPATDHTNAAASTASAYAQTHVNPTQTLASSGAWDPNDPAQPGNPNPNNGHEQNCRLGAGIATTSWGSNVGDPPHYPHAWVRLARQGAMLHGYRSDDGTNWIDQGTVTLTDQQSYMYVGPFLAVETGNIWAAGTFDVWNSPFDSKFDRLFVAQFREFGDVVSGGTIVPSRLTFSLSGKAVTINWTVAGTLLESPTVGAGATWTAVPNAPNTPTGGTITLTPSGRTTFFRLQQQ